MRTWETYQPVFKKKMRFSLDPAPDKEQRVKTPA